MAPWTPESPSAVHVTEDKLNDLLGVATEDSQNGAWLLACELARELGKDESELRCRGAELARTSTGITKVEAPPSSAN